MRALLAVSAERRIRSPFGATTSTHQVPPRLRSDIPSPFSESLATLAEAENIGSEERQQDRLRERPSHVRLSRQGFARASPDGAAPRGGNARTMLRHA